MGVPPVRLDGDKHPPPPPWEIEKYSEYLLRDGLRGTFFCSSINFISIAEISGSTTATNKTVNSVSPKNANPSSTTVSASTISTDNPLVITPNAADYWNFNATVAEHTTNTALSTDLALDMEQVYVQY